MAVTVIADPLNDGRMHTTFAGREFVRSYLVTGLSSAPVKFIEAETACITAGIYIGAPLIGILPVMYCEEISTEPVTDKPDAVHLTAVFRSRLPDNAGVPVWTIDISSSLSQEQTSLDASGTFMKVPYNSEDAQPYSGTKSLPEVTITYSSDYSVCPMVIIATYAGTTNKTTWNGGAPGTWLCTGGTGRTCNLGIRYVTSLSFQYREQGWTQKGMWLDPDTQLLPDDASEGNGYKTFTVQGEAEFHTLGLPEVA